MSARYPLNITYPENAPAPDLDTPATLDPYLCAECGRTLIVRGVPIPARRDPACSACEEFYGWLTNLLYAVIEANSAITLMTEQSRRVVRVHVIHDTESE